MVQVVLFDKEIIYSLMNTIKANEGKIIKLDSRLFEIPKIKSDDETQLKFTPVVYDDEYGFNRDICNDIDFKELIEIIENSTFFVILEQVDALRMVYKDVIDTSNAEILKLHQEFAKCYSVEFSQTPLSKFDLLELYEKRLNSDKIKKSSDNTKLTDTAIKNLVWNVRGLYRRIDDMVNHFYKELSYVAIDR